MPGAILNILLIDSEMFTRNLEDKHYYYSNFLDEETEAQQS